MSSDELREDVDDSLTQIHEQLYITSLYGARTCSKSQFDSIVTVCQDSIEEHADECEYYFYNMSDGETDGEGKSTYRDVFQDAASRILRELEKGNNVLVHCHLGRSRSVTTSIAALAVYLNKEYIDVETIIAKERAIQPNEKLISHAKRFIEESKQGRSP